MPARCFLAFDLPDEAIRRLADARRAFLEASGGWEQEKWVAPGLLHVTLKFIGPLEDASVDEAVLALLEACAPLPPAALELTGLRAVPSPRRANMLWATMRDVDGSVGRVAGVVDALLAARFGVPVSERAFAPHVTLARARRPRRAGEDAIGAANSRLAPVQDRVGPMSVPSLTLYSSTLGREGPTYAALADIAVGTTYRPD